MAEKFDNIEDYLAYVGQFRQNEYGRRFRGQFCDQRGTAELGMLAAPSEQEYEELARAVKAMTAAEKAAPEKLGNEQIKDIARTAGADCGNVSIFINGYVLARKESADQGSENKK